jgi:beta-galactosidase
VSMLVPESPVFDGIQPLDTAWFEMGPRHVPYACSGVYQVDWRNPQITALAHQCNFHSDLNKAGFFNIAGYPIVEIRLGKGIIIASEMMLSTRDKDPIAGRLLANMVNCLSGGPQ